MASTEIREYIHHLIEQADEAKLDAVLEILEPGLVKYSQQDLDLFYERVKFFEENDCEGLTVEQSHAAIRSKYKNGGI